MVFFVSLALLGGILVYFEYLKQEREIEVELFTKMKLCSFDLKCTQFDFDFVPLQSTKLYQLIVMEQERYALFSIPRNYNYALKLSFSQNKFEDLVYQIRITLLEYYLLLLIVSAILSILFSIYALSPLRRALRLTEEFSRDILHDLGTPLSALRLNVSQLSISEEESRRINRIKQSIEAIVALGDNLRNYLDEHERQIEIFEVSDVVYKRVEMVQKLYADIHFTIQSSSFKINTNQDAFIRIIDNLLSNASKYNTKKGTVDIKIDSLTKTLTIKDTGNGITHLEKIFDRFYKEQERGVGIGLHIVKKLCDEMKIQITVESKIGVGSSFTLHLTNQSVKN